VCVRDEIENAGQRSKRPELNTQLTLEVSRRMKLPHQDPADRFIVATAIEDGLTLIAADGAGLKSGACKTFDPS
jgi:PIN domain nuclease of toxin-antitoxin system